MTGSTQYQITYTYHMRYLFFLVIICMTNMAFCQETVNQLIEEGIRYHDAGEYGNAIERYQRALAVDERSPLAHYEIAMTYMYNQQYKEALHHADQVIALDDQYLSPAYMVKGNCLDAMGKSKKAIKVYQKGIKEVSGHYLLYYNLGVTYYKINRLDKAREALISAINDNANHSSSHLLLGSIMADEGNTVQSLLSLHYFLLLEPNSPRSSKAYQSLRKQFGGNMERNSATEITIMLNAASLKESNEFGAADMMISMLAASNTLEENQGKSEEALFFENTESFFKILGEMQKDQREGVWWNFYIPFFYRLALSPHLDTYCYYIAQSDNEKAAVWIDQHNERVEAWQAWLNGEQ